MTPTKLYPHIAGLSADEGESPTVLAITSILDPSMNWPSGCRIIVGSPLQSDKLAGEIPSVGGFCMGLAAAEEMINTLKQAVSDVRRALGQSTVPGPVPRQGNGFVRIGRIDEARRRSMWLKEERDAFELIAGRSGEDAHVRVTRENPQFAELEQVMACARFAAEWESSMGDALVRETAVNEAYAERNLCVSALVSLAMSEGWVCGLGRHQEPDGSFSRPITTAGEEWPSGDENIGKITASWDPEWTNVVFIDLPFGQVSWHIHDSEMPLFADLPPYDRPWDGHTTAEKYARLAQLRTLR